MLFGGQEELKKRTAERVKQYISHLNEYKRPNYNETEVRVDFVNPLFKSLGWDVDNEEGLPQHLREVTHEATVLVDEGGERRSKKPDYSFRIGTEILFYLETKKPYVDITTDNAPAFQLRRYGWSGNLKISVLTNYNDLYIYDCTVRPVEDDDIGVALIAHYGQIYELFLDEKLEIDRYGHVSQENKPEAVDSQGAVNTPKNVTDIIIEQTLSDIFAGKTVDQVLELRVAESKVQSMIQFSDCLAA